jgi:hypothetical protein
MREVRRPILNPCIEDWTEHRVLPDINIEWLDESQDPFVSAQPFV